MVLGCLLYVSMSGNKSFRLGGSALAQCFMQLGKDAPLMDDSDIFVKAFNTTQNLIQGKTENKLESISEICQNKNAFQ